MRKYENSEQIREKAKEYYKYCDENKKVKNIIGFCSFAKITETTFNNYLGMKELADGCLEIRTYCADELIQRAFSDPKTGNFAAFLLKTMHNFQEKTDTKVTINTNAQTVADLITVYADKKPQATEKPQENG